jgi:hypothetical protein
MSIRRLSHPPNSLDIALCDFRLFGYVKMQFEGMFFDTPAAL